MVLHALHLCSGYGGFELALRLAGIPARTVAHVERDAYAAATLVARMEEAHLDRAPVWSDVTTFDGGAWRGRVDLVTAGFPCQPFSTAGQQRGVDDDRWLWPAIAKVIGDVGPRFVFLENVPQLVRLGLPHVLSDLAVLGFDAEWGLYSAGEAGAPHRRDRIWLLGYARGSGRPEVPGSAPGSAPSDEATVGRRSDRDHVTDGAGQGLADSDGARRQGCWLRQHEPAQRRPIWPPGRDDTDGWTRWTTGGGPQPSIRRVTDGRPPGLADALHLGGNGLVPVVAARALVELADRADIDLYRLEGR